VTRTLVAAFLGGQAAWGVHLLLSYALADLGCRQETTALLTGRHVLTVLAVAAIGAVTAAVWPWPRGQGDRGTASPAPASAVPTSSQLLHAERRFLAVVALAINAIFLLAVLLAGSTSLVLVPCP
jgi:hypothetical protein